jgi:hypothetical protein
MKRLITGALAVIILSVSMLANNGRTNAQSIAENLSKDSGLFFGQKHDYSVIFRGNGEAIVYAKIVLTNGSETPMTSLPIQIPGTAPYEITSYQITLPQECVNNQYNREKQINECKEYRDADYDGRYYSGWSYNKTAKYDRVKIDTDGDKHILSLPMTIEPNKTSAVIISYATKDYVNKSAGLFKYTFPTIKVDSRIQDISVSVDVDSDLYLKGKKSGVDYGESGGGIADGLNSGISLSIESRDLDKISGSVGQYGVLIKTAKNLSPNESFEVRGEYANSKSRLYLSRIVSGILLVAGIIFGVWLINRLRPKKPKTIKAAAEHTAGVATPKNSTTNKEQLANISVKNLMYSLIYTVVCIGGSIGIFWLFLRIVRQNTEYYTTDYNETPTIIVIAVFILAVLVSSMLIIAPIVWIVKKHGAFSLLKIAMCCVLWLTILVATYFVFYSDTNNQQSTNKPPYYPNDCLNCL